MVKFLSILTFVFFSSIVLAQPPYGPDMVRTPRGVLNEWKVTSYSDQASGLLGGKSHTKQVTQKLCFYYAGAVDAHQRYLVVSSTFPGWYGTATQEGDLVRVKMTFWNGAGNYELSFNLTTMGHKDRGMGHWDETVEIWSPFGITSWANVEVKRVGRCRIAGHGYYDDKELHFAEELRSEMDYEDDQLVSPAGLNQDTNEEPGFPEPPIEEPGLPIGTPGFPEPPIGVPKPSPWIPSWPFF